MLGGDREWKRVNWEASNGKASFKLTSSCNIDDTKTMMSPVEHSRKVLEIIFGPAAGASAEEGLMLTEGVDWFRIGGWCWCGVCFEVAIRLWSCGSDLPALLLLAGVVGLGDLCAIVSCKFCCCCCFVIGPSVDLSLILWSWLTRFVEDKDRDIDAVGEVDRALVVMGDWWEDSMKSETTVSYLAMGRVA